MDNRKAENIAKDKSKGEIAAADVTEGAACEGELTPSTDTEYIEYRRNKAMEEARANVARMECDLLSVNISRAALKETCKSANALGLGAIVVHPSAVKFCVSCLGGDPVTSLIAAVSYPCGEDVIPIKVAAVKHAVKDGVDEVEVCAPMAELAEGGFAYFKKECKKIKKAAKHCAVRVVLDCKRLGEKELAKICIHAADAGINCVRLNGADAETVAKVKQALKGKCLIKADGAVGVDAFKDFCVMGADFVACNDALSLASLTLRQAGGIV